MKNPSKHSTTNKNKLRVPMIISMLFLVTMIALNVFVPVPEPQADAVCPMANAHVTWLDSFHAGAWGEAE